MSTLDLDAIRAKWLVQCGVHDAGLPMACACPDGDPRAVIDRLADEVAVLRFQFGEARVDCDDLRGRLKATSDAYNEARNEVERAHAETQEIAAELAQERIEHQRTIAERDEARGEAALLRASNEALAELFADEQAVHAKTVSNFEEFAESAIEERNQLRQALDDARRDLIRSRQAFTELVNGGASTGGDGTDG